MAALDSGELVIVPGDLRYFLVADALDDNAIERLFMATQRGADRPLTVLLSDYSDAHHVGYGDPAVQAAAAQSWPGPQTFALKPRTWIPDAVTAGTGTLRVMAPRQPMTLALARQFGPLAAASARLQGQPDSLDANTATARVGMHAALCIDAGTLPGGEEAHAAPEG